MSELRPFDEVIVVVLARDGDDWHADLNASAPDVHRQHVPGSGPGDVLERIGQHLDAREANRLTRERGFGELVVPVAANLVEPSTDDPWSERIADAQQADAEGAAAELDAELVEDDEDLADAVRRAAQDDPRGEADR